MSHLFDHDHSPAESFICIHTYKIEMMNIGVHK